MFESRFLRPHSFRHKRRRLSAEPLEARRVLATSLGWDGPGLGSAELTYHITNSPSSLSQAETNAAIETALNAWSNAADITFTPTDQSGQRDSIDFSFTVIDGVGGTLAQAYFPDDVNPARIAGDVQFDHSDAWEIGNSLGNGAFDLVYVAVHEIGHSLGLDHAEVRGSLLAPLVSPNQSFSTLDASDIAAIQELYAAADGVTSQDPPAEEMPDDDRVSNEIPTNEPDTDTDEAGDSDNDRFPRRRWRRGGNWHRWGGRLGAEAPEFNDVRSTNVNSDASASVFDALMIVHQLDRGSSGEDADTDGSATLAELETVITDAQREAFNERDADDDVLTEGEVCERFGAGISIANGETDGGVSLAEQKVLKAERQAADSDRAATQFGQRSHHPRSHLRSSDEVFAAIGRAVRRR